METKNKLNPAGSEQLELFSLIFEKNLIPPIYSGISYANETILNPGSTDPKREIKSIYSIRLVPGYLELSLKEPDNFTTKVIKQFNWGYAIFLKSIVTPDEYVKNQFGSNAKTIRRYVTRLEACFTIHYKMFLGAIQKEEYDFLMQRLKNMLIKRFSQRGNDHKEFKRWNYLLETTYHQILEKKASLFVIYNEDTPIEISLNYHFDKILFSSISSYDIDYSKFGLGHVEIYKQLEWCLANEIKVFEMGVGGMDYKRRWSNTVYQFEHHIVYNKHLLFAKAGGLLEIFKIRSKEYLKSKNINTLLSGVKSKLFGVKNTNPDSNTPLKDFEITPFLDVDTLVGSVVVEYSSPAYIFLRKPVYDFQYSHIEHKDDVTVYELEKDKSYVIKGKKNSQKVSL